MLKLKPARFKIALKGPARSKVQEMTVTGLRYGPIFGLYKNSYDDWRITLLPTGVAFPTSGETHSWFFIHCLVAWLDRDRKLWKTIRRRGRRIIGMTKQHEEAWAKALANTRKKIREGSEAQFRRY